MQMVLYHITCVFLFSILGIVQSITIAHENLQKGKIFINQGDLIDASINRSPTAYLCNPPEERAK